jgi:hypothetical protein
MREMVWMPFASDTGPRSCTSLLRQLPKLEEATRRDLLDRHARTCWCLHEQKACVICDALFSRWDDFAAKQAA